MILQVADDSQTTISTSVGSGGVERVAFDNADVVSRLFYFRVSYFEVLGCVDYGVEMTTQPGCNQDDMISNLGCFDGTILNGSFPQGQPINLVLQPSANDFFEYRALPPLATLNVTIEFDHDVADLDLSGSRLTQAGCSLLEASASTTDVETISVFNDTGVPIDVNIEAAWSGSAVGAPCTTYSFVYDVQPGSSPCVPDDAFESNDHACDAAPLSIGVYSDLRVGDGVPDIFEVLVPGDSIGTFAVDYDPTMGDVELALYEGSFDCGLLTPVGSSASGTGYEEVFVNRVGLPSRLVYVEVLYPTSDGGCTSYDLTIGEGNPNSIGERICVGEPNSTGLSSQVAGLGSINVADNAVILACSGLPPQTFGYFFNSRGYGFVANPAGSSGNICIAGGGSGRYVGPGEIQNSGQGSDVFLSVDLSATPNSSSGFVSVAPGETWYLQYWHRDASPAGATSNFSGAIRVRFL
ncbi:hypothetical protein Poly30_48030 [Planctomycetes bacterium Poly30]|uniref:Uncharacterized protein n=1 Tax=Saltatorellus ferox TaxID=2528018 RepID=A0A518EYS6_9BACT|nr:hypothetical protein Poly30_48030 [Planctomycetes bacterium Poly30]